MALSASQQKALAEKIGNKVEGIDLSGLLDFIKGLMPIIMSLPCFMAAKKNAARMKANLEDNFRDVRKNKKTRVPAKVKRYMQQNGYEDEDTQLAIWDVASEEAFLNADSYAKSATK